MNIPGFTADISLGTMKRKYALIQGHDKTTNVVEPQFFCRRDEGGTTCYQCWDEGGITGCYSFRVPHLTLH